METIKDIVHELVPCKVCHIWHCSVCGCHKARWVTESAA